MAFVHPVAKAVHRLRPEQTEIAEKDMLVVFSINPPLAESESLEPREPDRGAMINAAIVGAGLDGKTKYSCAVVKKERWPADVLLEGTLWKESSRGHKHTQWASVK